MSRSPKISLCMIVHNEEDFLANCLRSVRDVVDEIIVVDTGSTDSTPAIAAEFGARVFEHEWRDDFSEARNHALDHATGDWILVLDADETIAQRDVNKIRSLADGTADGYLFTYRAYSRESNDIRWIANDGAYREGDGWDGYLTGRVVRMFRRDDRIRFRGVVHESVDPSIRAFGGTLAETDAIIHHFHERKGQSKVREKQLHYLRLCEKNLERYPHSVKSHFDMGLIYRYVLDDIASSIPHLMRAVQLDPRFEEARMALAFAHHLNGDQEAATAELTTLLQHNPSCAPALLLCGIMLERRGRIERAIECYERVAGINPNLVDARLNLGTLFLKKGDSVRARSEWESVHSMNPSNSRALLNLGALALRDGDRPRARQYLEQAIEQSPNSASLWNNMGVLHAGEGRTDEALEAFERAVELDPSSADARRNLDTIRNRSKATA